MATSFKDQLQSFTKLLNPSASINDATAQAKTEIDAAKEAAIQYATVDIVLKVLTLVTLAAILYKIDGGSSKKGA